MKKKITFLARLKLFVRDLGPGLVTGASDDDPSGIATYSQAGAGFGLAMLWTAWLTFPLMAAVQAMCARIGLVTGHGLAKTLKIHYPRPVLYFVILLSFPAIVLNVGADIEGMGAVAHLLVPFIPAAACSVVFTALLMLVIIKFSYQRVASLLKWLCLILLSYILVPFLIHTRWSAVLRRTIIPEIHWDRDFFSMLVAILGTTISPYLFFWQATMEAEDRAHRVPRVVVNKRLLDSMKTDVNLGMFLSNLIMFFIILTAGGVLYEAGIRKIDTVEQAAQALGPLTGKFSYFLFALGVIGTGCLAIPVLAGSFSYIVAESFNWRQGLDKKFNQAKPFYLMIVVSLLIGLSLQFAHVSPIQALLYTAILYGLTAPVMIVLILLIGNNARIMGNHCNGWLSNLLGFLTLILMTAAAGLLIYYQVH